jgi:hypothetical protein
VDAAAPLHLIRQLMASRNMLSIRSLLRAVIQRYQSWRTARLNRRIAHSDNHAEVFTAIYETNHWDAAESRSGPGSTLAYTKALRQELPRLFDRYRINSIFDAPCGDFHWMPDVLAHSQVQYLGGDIVPSLVAQHRRLHADERINFREFDLVRDELPAADLWLCRDCLFHLPYADIYAVLARFARSSIRYALLTNHRNLSGFTNHDIRIGGFRKLDLSAAPFGLMAEPITRVTEGGALGDGEHEMCLWERSQIAAALPAFARQLGLPPPPAAPP